MADWPAVASGARGERSASLASPFGQVPGPIRVCMLSYHTCPLAAPGGKESGGMNVYVRELMRQLGRRGVAVDAFTRSQSSLEPHVPDTDLGPGLRVIHVTAGPEAPLSKAEAYRYLPQFVDGVRAFRAAHDHSYDLYHSHYWMSGWAAQRLAVWRPAPIVQMFHTLGAMKDLARDPGDPPEIEPRRAVEYELLHSADVVVAATDVDRQHMIDLYGADPATVRVIPPGVDLNLFRPIPQADALARLGDGPDHRMILFVGRMDPVKGLETLVRAVALLIGEQPEWRQGACLCIVGGDKPDNPAALDATARRIDQLRSELALGDFVTFLGPQSQADLPFYYSGAQVVVVPSRYESFGMVALEAMACGAPVIASNVGGLSTLVRDGRTGFLVPDGDPEALADRLRLLFNDRILRDEMGAHATAVAEAYAWPVIAERIEGLYEETMRRSAFAPR